MDTVASTADQSITLSFEVTNTGQTDADEIAQIYLSPQTSNLQSQTSNLKPQTSNLKPQTLQGFARVSLHAGQTRTVKVKLYTEQFGYYTHEGERQWNVAPGDYIIKIGASSADIRLQQHVVLTGQTVKKPLREYYFSDIFVN